MEDIHLCCFLQLSPDCRYLQTTVTMEIGAEIFTCTGKVLLDPGYTTMMTWQALTSDEDLPPFERGQICQISEVSHIVIRRPHHYPLI